MLNQISSCGFSRAGLLGNPSDGFGGKTISLIVRNFRAQVTLTPAARISIVPANDENPTYDSIYQLVDHVAQCGYYGAVRLIKASIKRFADFVMSHTEDNCENCFSITYQTNIPRSVGLAGSSAIVVATLKALAEFYGVDIKPSLLASLALSVELDELGIPAGLQDRVIQAFEGIVFMDFSEPVIEQGLVIGKYEKMKQVSIPNLYIAFGNRAAEPTETVHGDLRSRFHTGDQKVIDAMTQFADFAERGKTAIQSGHWNELSSLLNANFDLRSEICDLNPFHTKMIETARRTGASAKFCGSGGAIIGTCPDQACWHRLQESMTGIDCQVIEPQIFAA